MKKLYAFNDIKILIKFFFNNALKGMLSRPIMAKRSTRLLIISALLISYIAYFVYNMMALNKIYSPLIYDDIASKITFYSYISNVTVLTILIYLIVDGTISLDKNSLFFVKVLPFKTRDINIAYILFKFIMMMVLYLFFSLIISFVVKFITANRVEYILIVISQYMIVLNVICLLELINNVIISISLKFKKLKFLKGLYHCVILFITIFYFFDWRFVLESIWAQQTQSIFPVIVTINIILLISGSLLFMRILLKDMPNRIDNHGKFMYIKFLPKTIFRYKKNWYILLMLLIFISVVVIQSGFYAMLLALANALPILGILLLPYADITADFRKQYALLRINLVEDCLKQWLLVLALLMPSLLCYFGHLLELDKILFTICLSMVALILGFIFPKSYSTMNEMSALILLVILIAIMNMFFQQLINGVLIMGGLMVTHYFIVRRIRHESIQ